MREDFVADSLGILSGKPMILQLYLQLVQSSEKKSTNTNTRTKVVTREWQWQTLADEIERGERRRHK